jgi:uroporphyrinogen decarboxylase
MSTNMSPGENFLRTVNFRNPAWVPLKYEFLPSVLYAHGDRLKNYMSANPENFPAGEYEELLSFGKGPLYTEGARFIDDWGCGWYNAHHGILGHVTSHPLLNWKDLKELQVPDPDDQEDWQANADFIKTCKDAGEIAPGYPASFAHGGFFDRLQFLRSLENLLIDFMTDPPQLAELMDILLQYNLKYIDRWIELQPDFIWLHGDFGTQNGLLFSPEIFRKYLKPAYKTMFSRCREAGVHVWYSCDGNILDVVDDLIECGVSIHDPQVAPNGIDGIEKHYKGRMCPAVDIDEQMLPFFSPKELGAQVKEVISRIGSNDGGLMLFFCPSADVPMENIEAFFKAWNTFKYL